MPATTKILAFDLGAESGRGILGHFDGNKLDLEIVHRFANTPVRVLDSMHWNVLSLYREMVHSMQLCAAKHGGVDSIGVDTWGVDFALLGRNGELLGNPRHYRDPHTEGIMEATFAKMPRGDLFAKTGLQFMRFNSLFQLLAMKRDNSAILDVAETFLMMPDLFHYFFTGMKVVEYSNASTSQMLDPNSRTWAVELVEQLGLPSKLLGNVVQPGTSLGPLRTGLASETGLTSVPVIAPATHDTGSAVAAVPARPGGWAYISSGTWSLMGVETPTPVLTEKALEYNFTNEGGVGGTIRLLKNIMGLWLVQECKRAWERDGQDHTYEELVRLAEQAPAFGSIIDPDDESFILPSNMPKAIADFCTKTNQPAPEGVGPTVRCALESLALRYRWVLLRLEEMTGTKIDTIHIVGGGSQNDLLSQLTADACNCEVVAGPVEATAIGNLLVQAMGLGLVADLDQAREVVRSSFETRTFTPKQPEAWQESSARFEQLQAD